MFSICALAFQRHDFELKPTYLTLVGQAPFHGLSHEHPIDQLERFEDLVSAIKANGVPGDSILQALQVLTSWRRIILG